MILMIKSIDGYNSRKKQKVLAVFDDVFADMISNKNSSK